MATSHMMHCVHPPRIYHYYGFLAPKQMLRKWYQLKILELPRSTAATVFIGSKSFYNVLYTFMNHSQALNHDTRYKVPFMFYLASGEVSAALHTGS
jgi:hypothetical protein